MLASSARRLRAVAAPALFRGFAAPGAPARASGGGSGGGGGNIRTEQGMQDLYMRALEPRPTPL